MKPKGLRTLLFLSVLNGQLLLAPTLIRAAEPGRGKAGKHLLLGADVILVGTATALLLGQRKAASDYETLYAATNQSTDEAVQNLISEKDKVDSKAQTAGIVGAVAGTAVAYTLLDALVLHKVFRKRMAVIPTKRAIEISMSFKF